MNRRDSILGLLALGTAPVVFAAQKPAVPPRIGYLGTSSLSMEPRYVEAFRQRLRELGYIEGQNIAIEYLWARS